MFLANENFPRPSTDLLRENGFHVVSIQEKSAGASDEAVLQKAIEQDLIILTFDRDYGELIFRYAQQNPPGDLFQGQRDRSFICWTIIT
jgi:predicted nuclease of predicted toxin-antitoxin system